MLSFIIPAYNEENNISKTIEMIKLYAPGQYDHEIIVVDHGSQDNTVDVATNAGARVFSKNDGTIAGLRNYGVEQSSGDILIFIDSDISLTKKWQENIGAVLERLRNGEKLLTGSWYSVPDKPNWIEKYWFEPLEKINNTHINSGHMIVSRKNFHEIAGFDEKLETGEDYDISMRAKAHGLAVIDDHKLKVIHEGYPKGLWEFMLREYWHGKGDSSSIGAVIHSKVALLSLLLILLHLALLTSLMMGLSPWVSFACIFSIVLICAGVSYVKFKNEPLWVIIVDAVLYYFYFLSRSVSLLSGIFRRGIKKRQR